MESIIVVPD